MIDRFIKPALDPVLLSLAKPIAHGPITANQLSLLGALVAIMLGYSIWQGYFILALGLIFVNRLLDGLDGMIARLTKKNRPSQKKIGGFVDTNADYIFYGIVPMAFALHNPNANALASSWLLLSFIMTAVSFLSSALLHEKLGSAKDSFQKTKSFFYSIGIMEGSETILFFIAFCLFPDHYAPLATLAAGLCFMTAAVRFYQTMRL